MATPSSDDSTAAPTQSLHDRVKLNVGGVIFDTTIYTLNYGGPDSLLTVLSDAPSHQQPIFIDRDPKVFSILLSLLRTVSLPSTARCFPMWELAEEALYYGVEPLLQATAALPPLQGFDAASIAAVHPTTDRITTAFSTRAEDGSPRGHHPLDGSLRSQIYKATVTAIAVNPGPTSDTIYASFECSHNENCILAVDCAMMRCSVSSISATDGTRVMLLKNKQKQGHSCDGVRVR
ncbi:hypothetical protein Taro_048774 [Colocasia esculenta]|uniref:Potassium channel tetramerisation-type BTB domain-containing protein n=1 Tax=Colocasia esculenta TaxID=4460 RepID=A0A843X912_COLES|nr:hypothetical protein [Colocasia esculenta]